MEEKDGALWQNQSDMKLYISGIILIFNPVKSSIIMPNYIAELSERYRKKTREISNNWVVEHR